MRCLLISAILAVTLVPRPAAADARVILLDKTRVVGTLLHYYDGVFTLRVPGGGKVRIPARRVRRVEMKLPRPRAALGSPRKTFKRLRRAALTGDIATYVDCHAAFYVVYLERRIATAGPVAFARRLKKEWGDVQLEVRGVKIKGDTAVLTVRRKRGDERREGELRFVRENGEWKMILPL